jgi:hypothetical protein
MTVEKLAYAASLTPWKMTKDGASKLWMGEHIGFPF